MSRIVVRENLQIMSESSFDWRLWRQWILANTLGEVIGLGAAALVGIWLMMNYEQSPTTLTIVLTAVLMIAAGTFEGVIVGYAQAFVLRRRIENFNKRGWILATAIGAFIAWTLGGIPSAAMSLQENANATPPSEISDAVMYGMAMLMGFALGFTLGVPQWLVLRRYVWRAGYWTLANALAWAFGMPVVFIAAGSAPPANYFTLVVWLGLVIGLAGAIVGAIHGLFLVWLLNSQGKQTITHAGFGV